MRGDRESFGRWRDLSEVHPHVRGDRAASAATMTPWLGSSPRAWGQGVLLSVLTAGIRFIPTCVGTGQAAANRHCNISVHPHMRGDRPYVVSEGVARIGSSPHAWGQVRRRVYAWSQYRFIPTCVGTGRACGGRGWAGQVHPHMRGDRVIRMERFDACPGSSPHAWGQGPSYLSSE